MKKGLFFSLIIPSLLGGLIITSNHSFALTKAATGYEEINTSVKSITIKTQDSGYAVAFELTNSDYKGGDWVTSINGIGDLDFLDHIKFSKYNTSYFTGERFINVWNYDGCFVLRFGSSASNASSEIDNIIITAGCEFPSYNYGKGNSSTKTCYKTTEDLLFRNDGTGKFSLDLNYSDYTLPSGYDVKWTDITSIKEQNHYDYMSFLQFNLSNSDYNGLGMTTIGRTYIDKLYELNYQDYIYVNNIKLTDLVTNKYDAYGYESFVNLFNEANSFSFRKPGNNTGSHYKSGSISIETDDTTCYEVAIAAGCPFPSYKYLSGQISTPTCYVTSKPVRFVWDNNKYIKYDDYVEPTRIESRILSCASHGSNADTGIDFVLDNYDFPNTVHDGVIHNTFSNLTFTDRIFIITNTDNIVFPSTERFVNVWGDTSSFSIRKPSSLSFNDIKYVVAKKGCEFPTYDSFTNGTSSRLITDKTYYFVSNGDGTFIETNNETASSFASKFLSATDEICQNYDGVSDNESYLVPIFEEYAEIFNMMVNSEQNNLKSGIGDYVNDMLDRYDYLISKYDLTDFLSRKNLFSNVLTYETNSNNYIVFVAIGASFIILSFAVFKALKERKYR